MKMNTATDVGALRKKLAKLKTTKFAALGGEPSTGFESSFASLAYVYIQDKAPALLDHMIGFQLVENNEENTRAVGVFGFKLGPTWLYIPVFWLNGEVKGHELLYLKKQDLFVPLKENWVNYILRQQPSEMGSGVPGDPSSLGLGQPDLETLRTPPETTKISSWKPVVGVKPWAKEAVELIPNWAFTSPSQNKKYASWSLDLKKALSSDLGLAKAAVKYSSLCPALSAGFDQFYGPNFLRDCLLTLREKAAAEDEPVKNLPAQTRKSKLTIIADADLRAASIADIPGLSESEKTKLLRDGYLVKDNRPGEQTSRAYNFQLTAQFTNPDQSGVYDVLTSDDAFEKCLVLVHPRGSRKHKRFATVVRLSDKAYENYPVQNVHVRLSDGVSDSKTEYRKWMESLPEVSTLTESAKYVIVTDDGKATAPFSVESNDGDKNYAVSFDDYCSMPATFGTTSGMPEPYFNSSEDTYIDVISLNRHRGADFVTINNKLLVPPSAKIFQLSEAEKCEGCSKDRYSCTCSYFKSPRRKKPLSLASMAEVQARLFQKTAELKIWHDSHELVINRSRMTKKAGLLHLIGNHGFTERDAIKMIKESEKRGGMRYRVKYAAPYPNQFEAMQGPGMPYFPELGNEGFAQDMGGVMANYPDEQDIAIDDLAAEGEQDMLDNMPPDQMAMLASQAAQTGQKEVFDTAVIGSLVNAVRQDSIIDRYLGDLTTGLDRLGRLLFMFYWHNDEFADRFGKSDLPELEDSLRNAFEGMGDLVLYLKQKNVNTFNIAGGFGEPSLEG